MVAAIARGLVEHPEAVQVDEVDDRDTTIVELNVAQGDMGRVIGRGGRVANSLRTLVRGAAAARGDRARLDIVD